MEILTKQSHEISKVETVTPGIVSTKAFHDFCKKLFNRYIYIY